MTKIRVHELAKEINESSAEIVKILQEKGTEVKNHMSVIDENDVQYVKNTLSKSKPQAEKPQEEKPQDEKPQEEKPKQPKIIYTTKGAVRQKRPEGERRRRPEGERGERRRRPEGERGERRRRPEGEKTDIQKSQAKMNESGTVNNAAPKEQQKVTEKTVSNAPKKEEKVFVRSEADKKRSDSERRNDKPRKFDSERKNFGPKKDYQNKDFRGRNTDTRRNDDGKKGDDTRRNDRRNSDFRKDNRTSETPMMSTDKDRRTRENKVKQDKKDKKDKNYNQYEDGGKRQNRGKKNGQNAPVMQKPQQKKEEPKEEIKVITIPETLTIKELADAMKLQSSALIKKLFLAGQMVTLNTEIDFSVAEEIALDYEIMCEKEVKVDIIEELLKEDEEDEALMSKRPPVVCVMGHVDHGKTSLLDAIRKTNVIQGEAGGITQHIGAYMVEINGEKITFLDTPGHEAFTSMRMRGAQSTDIAVLVVAADDGVMPQTVEAINHAKAANIEIVVAINKIDKQGANIDRVKQELAEHELIPEDWGGNTVCVPVSAHSGEGIDSLLEMIILQSEVLELKANPNRKARGLIIEAELDKGKGAVATVLVQKGTLKVGDTIAAGPYHGKVRAMMDDKGNKVKEAGPSTPVEILGLNGVPNAGDTFVATLNDKEARNFAETFIKDSREKLLEGTKSKLSLDDLFTQIKAGDVKELELIVKADVQGSVEAVKQSLEKLSNEEVVVKVIHGGVGTISESDVILASASNAIIIGFNVRPDNQAKEIAAKENVDLRLYNVIYNAIEDVEAAMKGMLDPVYEEKVIGHAEIRQLFKASGVGTIAGSYVLDGMFQRGCQVRITREGEQVYEGPLASLKRFKDDVKEVKAGFECGFVFEKFNDIKEGDIVEAYIMVEVPR